MKIKQTIIALSMVIGIAGGLTVSAPAYANNSCGVETSVITCTGVKKDSGKIEDTGAWAILKLAIQIMTAGIFIVAVGGIVYGAVLYASAADSAEQVKKARTVITNVVIGLVAYGLMYVILNYLIPGGLFN